MTQLGRKLTPEESDRIKAQAQQDAEDWHCPHCGSAGPELRSYLAAFPSVSSNAEFVIVPFFCPKCPDVEPIKKTYFP